MNTLYKISILFLLFGCGTTPESPKNSKTLRFVENMTFESGFLSGNVQIENFLNEEFVCFGDYKTHKKIIAHSLDSDKEYSINLKKIADLGENILAYEIMNLDTVLVLSRYTNHLYCIDQHGHIWKSIDLSPYLDPYGEFELMRSSTPFQFNDTTLIFSLGYLVTNLPEKDRENLTLYSKMRNKAPILFKVDNIFSDTLHTKLGLENLYTQFSKADRINIEGHHFEFDQKSISFYSAYSDSIYIIDPKTLRISKRRKVTSKYSKLRINALSVQEFNENPDLLNKLFITNGQIRGVVWDKGNQVYYCFTSHKSKGEKIPMSIIVLDDQLNKISEHKLDENKYQFTGLITSKGLLVSNYNETLNDSDHFQKNTYALFHYE